jgi:antibiotic biosynthesis monooxygenase (ABM) superfamily enzyme
LTYGELGLYRCWPVMREQPDNPARARRWLAALATTVGAWLVAFLVVTAILSLFGDELGSLPLALRALVISGVLVALMVNLVMPVLSIAVARWLAGPLQTRLPSGRLRPTSGEHTVARAPGARGTSRLSGQ